MKVCPRCSFVDTEGRQVCLACRRSLIATPDLEVAPELAVERSSVKSRPLVSVGSATGSGFGGGTLIDHSQAAQEARLMEILDQPETAGDTEEFAESVEADIAEVTRQQLARLYDPRTAAPVLLDVDTTVTPARAETDDHRSPAQPRFRAGRWVLAVLAVVALVVSVRQVRGMLDAEAGVAVRNPDTPIDELPWRRVQRGGLALDVPTAPVSSTNGSSDGTYRYDRYTLPDIALTVTTRGSQAALNSEVALRSYATEITAQLGGRVVSGHASDLRFATAFSAMVALPEGPTYLYVLSGGTEIIEVRAQILDDASERALLIYERVIQSIDPA